MRRFLSKKYRKSPPTKLVMVRRWPRSVTGEGRWGSLTKCGVTESVTDHRSHDGPSYWFVMKIREVVPVPKFQEFKCFYNGDPRREKQKNLHKYGTTESMTVRRDHDDPSRGPSIQPRFDKFPANRVLI
ncbi:hypothetical protein EJD97_008476 [Solanum chilense]|uniref:Uncharacterized protein n=1 Tax=Solanum chilense TaxID=4083 RepID=A0A6N2ANZ0_SOLCI|nr:hypothetical protein EJD97_008476 [Solanum chilense]